MKANKLLLKPAYWYGCRVIPDIECGWSSMSSSPVLVTAVKPLKTGHGLLQLRIVPLLYPDGPKEINTTFKVIHHGTSHLVATTKDFLGTELTVVFEDIDLAWLGRHNPRILWQISLSPWSKPRTAQDGLVNTIGDSLHKVIAVATPDDYYRQCTSSLSPMPEQKSCLPVTKEYSEYDSFLITKGHVPMEMEDKWFIYCQDDRLFFHRSWSGLCIFEVHLGHHGKRLYLRDAYVNRDIRQYKETDDAQDQALLLYLIAVVLLGEPAPFPMKSSDGELSVLEQWSFVGKYGANSW